MNAIRKYRTSILFVVGLAIIVFVVVNSIVRDKMMTPGLVILGTTLCGVGITQAKDGVNGAA